MQIGVVGCGAIGGLLTAHLATVADRVTVCERGSRLEALQANGLELRGPDGSRRTVRNLDTVGSPEACAAQDVVFLAVKSHEIPPLIPAITSLLHDETVLVPVQNGIPWWYFQRHGGAHDGRVLASVDPGGSISRHIPAGQIVGCVAYPAAQVDAPGVVYHVEGHRFPIGELDGRTTDRAERISALLTAAGFKAPILDDIRSELWLKAWGNLAFNPISALTGATMAEICRFPGTRRYAAELMTEAAQVAQALGVTFRVSLEHRLAGAEKVGAHKTSMLQDLEAGRELELDALVGAIIELADLTGVPAPGLRNLYALTRLRDLTNRQLVAASS